MKVSKKQVLYWGTIALLAIFAIEFFWVFLYAPSLQQQSPSPSPQKEFDGRALASAVVKRFSHELLIQCNSSNPFFLNSLREIPGMANAFEASEFVVVASLNSSLNASQANESVTQILELVSMNCAVNSIVFRNAFLSLLDKNYSFQSLLSVKEFKTLYQKDLLDAFHAFGSKEPTGFVDAGVKENESIHVIITIKMRGDHIVDKPVIEQYKGGWIG